MTSIKRICGPILRGLPVMPPLPGLRTCVRSGLKGGPGATPMPKFGGMDRGRGPGAGGAVATNRPDREDAVGDLVDYLTGSPAENAQHVIARRAFLAVFRGDPQVGDLLQRWEDATCLWEFRSYLETVIIVEKARYWHEVLDPDGRTNFDRSNNHLTLDSPASPETVEFCCGGVIERALQAVSGVGDDPMWGPSRLGRTS